MKPRAGHDYHRRIAHVIQVTLADPVVSHTVQSLAAVAHLSSFHLHCIHRALIGEGVFETVQHTWLTQAARCLSGAKDSVTDVALNVGYGSPQAFMCAFCKFTGVSPCTLQIRQQVLNVCSVDTEDLLPIELIQQLSLHALCLRHDGSVATIRQTFITLRQSLGIDMESADAPDRIDICHDDPETSDSFEYFTGVILDAPRAIIGPLPLMRIEGGFYACHRPIGPYVLIAPIMQALYGGCLSSYGLEPDDWSALELYRSPGWHHLPCVCVIDLMVSIRKE